ncbi:uncharacterized protein LOC108602724 [Drosophila busckii]|uniref:uncharacterized protein LOC108602724 n=1 Tax=Drosophila busckii TaxID=30019 RepID=UPI00083ECF64|nr:uncharacterized protein LOC108602724 [Drosophila busckii]
MLSCFDNYVCDRYTVDVVYAIVNDRCLVFQNICFLKKFNCKRINQCLPSVPQTTYRGCYSACQFTCNVAESLGVCATFYDASQLLGTKISFASKCEADKYACQNRVAYTEITTGFCP